MTIVSKYFIILALVLFPLAGQAGEHKPPILTTTAIIEVWEEGAFKGIVLIERGKAPWGKAIPGGKVEYGETVENAVRREMMEEVGLELDVLRQFHVYSDPSRDFRHHSVEVTHIAKAYGLPHAGDDAAKAFIVTLDEIPWSELAFDHAQILKDYLAWRGGKDSLCMPMDADELDGLNLAYFNNFETLARSEKWEEIIAKGAIALNAAKQARRPEDEAKICAELASTAYYMGNYSLALEYASRCHELSEEFTDPALFIRALYLESAIYRAFGGKASEERDRESSFLRAVGIGEEALSLYAKKDLQNPHLLGKVYFNLGAAHADNPKGDLEKAVNDYFSALECFKQSGATNDVIRTSIRLGKVYLIQKRYALSQRIIDEVRPKITSERLAMHADYLEAQLKLETNEAEQAIEIAKRGLKRAQALGAKEDAIRFQSLLKIMKVEDVFCHNFSN